MRKPILTGMAFVAADQLIKLVIRHFAYTVQTTLVPGVLYFSPVRNTNLNWLASMAGFPTPVWMMVTLQFMMLALVVLLYRYLSYRALGGQKLLSLFFSFAVAGIACSFIDVVFWGGSLDFLGLFDWFVFDTKDLFLHSSYIVLAFWEIRREKGRPGGEAARGAFRAWLRLGCPMKPGAGPDGQPG